MIEKIKGLIESLLNELENLQTMLVAINSDSERIKEKEIELSNREISVTERESKSISQTKTNEQTKKMLDNLQSQLEAKQGKLQDEWDRMLTEKEEWNGIKESMIKEKLRLENLGKELDRAKTELFEKETIMAKKQESIQTMTQMLAAKEKALNNDQAKVNKYLNQI